jgi:HEAT repeat protein
MGAAAVPYLIAALDHSESLRNKVENLFDPKLPIANQRYMLPQRSAGLRRLRATAVLGRIGPRATNAVPLLIRLLTADSVSVIKGTNTVRGPDQSQRQEAVRALKAIGIPGSLADQSLTSLLTNRDFRLRGFTSELVTNVHPPFTREFILGLTAALRSKDERFRPYLLFALKRCHAEAEMAWPDLAANLQHTNGSLRWCAAEALGVLGPATAAVLAALEKAVDDEQPQVRMEGAFALWKNTPGRDARFVHFILDRLQDEKVFWRRKAARYLVEMRPSSLGVIQALKPVLNDPDPETRLLALRGIVQIDPEQTPAVLPVLRDALLDRGPRRRTSSAAQILGDLGPRAQPAVPALVEATEDSYAPAKPPPRMRWRRSNMACSRN